MLTSLASDKTFFILKQVFVSCQLVFTVAHGCVCAVAFGLELKLRINNILFLIIVHRRGSHRLLPTGYRPAVVTNVLFQSYLCKWQYRLLSQVMGLQLLETTSDATTSEERLVQSKNTALFWTIVSTNPKCQITKC